jgi:dihydroorotase
MFKGYTMNNNYLIYNAHCLDSENSTVFEGSIVIKNGIIVDIIHNPMPDLNHYADITHINAQGQYLSAGFIDISVGIGGVHSDNFVSISGAALKGGVTSIIIEPNMMPPIDNPAACDYALNVADKQAHIHVYVMGSLTKNHEMLEIAPIGLLKQAGAIGLSFTDTAIDNNLLLYRCLSYSKNHDMLVTLHPEDNSLASNGIANEGFVSSLYGLPAHPVEAELLGLERDLLLAEKAGVALHIKQISSQKSLDIIKRYKDKGTDVTVSCSMQHIALNENDIIPYRTFFKMKPPLRSEQDRMALMQAVCHGDIDIVTSSHRPRSDDVKRLPYAEADFGCSSIETLLSVMLNVYHGQSEYNLAHILRCVTINPAKRFGLASGRLSVNAPADIIIFDADYGYRMSRESMVSNATNTPYDGQLLQGKVVKAFVNGIDIPL